MNFISNVLDSLPVVGHIKGVVHYTLGDTDGGNKAIYQATRTSAIIGAGTVGSLAGPAGAVAAAMYAGVATDAMASIAMDEPQGTVKDGRNPTGSILSTGFQLGLDGVGGLGMGGVFSAATQASEQAVAKTVENVGKKVVTAVGEEVIEKSVKITAEEMAKIATKKVSEKVVQKTIQNVGKKVITTVGEEVIENVVQKTIITAAVQATVRTQEEKRAKEERKKRAEEEKERRAKEERERRAEERERRAREESDQCAKEENERRAKEESKQCAKEETCNSAKEEKEKAATSGTGSGSSQPPQGNKDDNKKSNEMNYLEKFKIFIDILMKLLELIYDKKEDEKEIRRISAIFENLSRRQKKTLVKKITILINIGLLDKAVELVIKMFKKDFPRDISFPNFLSLLEFVATIICNETEERNQILRGTEATQPEIKFEKRRTEIISDITSQDCQEDIIQKIIDQFKTVQDEIESETASPNFRDIFSAVNHYFKHRCDPSGNRILTVKEYYYWIRKLLAKLGEYEKYAELLKIQASGDPRKDVIYQSYVEEFGRRFKIVVRFQYGKIVLLSCFIVASQYPGDKEGDEWIEIFDIP